MKQFFFSLITTSLNLLKLIFLLLLLFTNDKIRAQEDLGVIQQKGYNWIQYTDASNSLYHHLSGQVYDLLDIRANTIAEIHSLSDWQQRQEWLHQKLRDIVGPFPTKTPLNAKILRAIDKDGYRVEHIVYESQPGFYVTSSLFIPDGLKGKAPVVIYCSGHANEGYRSPVYQHVILNLVKKGFIVLAFDPVGQGERLEYYDQKTAKSSIGGPTREHSYPGTQAFITGSSEALYMIWDGIRTVDYLLTRKEIDSERIGITGRSGGGTQSAYIAAFDDRIKAAAPECYITNFTRLFESIGPQDAEQNLFHQLKEGIDHADLLLARAPKPALIITTTRDMFSIHGARETAKEVSRIYKAYGKKDNFRMIEDDAPHESTEKNRESMYAFFQQHLDNPGDSKDQDVEILNPEEIQVTRTGQVSTSLGGETVFSLNRRETKDRLDELQASREEVIEHLYGVLKSSKKLSGYRAPSVVPEPIFVGRFRRDGYMIEKYFVKGEGNYVIPYLLMKPDEPNHKALIYLHPSGKAVEASEGGEIEWFVRNGFTVLAPDIIGVGEMGPGDFQGDAYINGNSYNTWYASLLIGRSIVGIRAGDVVRLTRLLEKKSGTDEIYGFAREGMAPVLLHAAAFEPAISRIALIKPYSSYRSIVMNRFYNPDFIHSTVPGALEEYDLPDLAATLAPRKLLIAGATEGVDPTKMSDSISIENDLSIIKAAYQKRNAGGQLEIIEEPSVNIHDLYEEWIK